MDTSALFFDCPAYLSERATARCGLLAEAEDVYWLTSTEGLVECARIRCPAGHHFNGPVEAFRTKAPPPAPEADRLTERQ